MAIETTSLAQRAQSCDNRHVDKVAWRQRFHGIFIEEASILYMDALTRKQIDPSKFVRIYATIGRLRLFAPADVVSTAVETIRKISEIDYLPNRDFSRHEIAPTTEQKSLRVFTDACRNELRA